MLVILSHTHLVDLPFSWSVWLATGAKVLPVSGDSMRLLEAAGKHKIWCQTERGLEPSEAPY